MKKATAGLLLAIGAASTQAATVTYEYTAVINRMELAGTGWVDSTNAPGFYSQVGETVTGTFSYDTKAPLLWTFDYAQYGSSATYAGDGSISSSITFGGSGYHFVSGPAGVVTVNNVTSGDYVEFRTPASGTPPVMLELTFFGYSPSVLGGTTIPWTTLGEFESAAFAYRFNGDAVSIYGDFTSLKVTSAVPEPGTIGMLLAGLGVVALRRRTQTASRLTQ